MIVIYIIKVWLLSWVVSSMINSISDLIESDKLFINIIQMGLTCNKCVSFWFSLIYTKDIFIASLIAFMMFIYGKIKFFNETEL
jgi:hypothetical protein